MKEQAAEAAQGSKPRTYTDECRHGRASAGTSVGAKWWTGWSARAARRCRSRPSWASPRNSFGIRSSHPDLALGAAAWANGTGGADASVAASASVAAQACSRAASRPGGRARCGASVRDGAAAARERAAAHGARDPGKLPWSCVPPAGVETGDGRVACGGERPAPLWWQATPRKTRPVRRSRLGSRSLARPIPSALAQQRS